MVEVFGLTKYYNDIAAIQDISFKVRSGEILGLLGPNGAGKTTTMRILAGYMPATQGTATVQGFDIFKQSREAKKQIGYLPENPPLYDEMTVSSYLKFAARIKGTPRKSLSRTLDAVLEQCALVAVASRLIRHLSRGFRQRVGLAQALVHDPPVLILDEPTLGLDPRQITEIRALIKQLSVNRTVVLSTHILPEVSQICDKVVIINEGKLAVEKSLRELTENATLEEVFLRYISEEFREPTIELEEEWSL